MQYNTYIYIYIWVHITHYTLTPRGNSSRQRQRTARAEDSRSCAMRCCNSLLVCACAFRTKDIYNQTLALATHRIAWVSLESQQLVFQSLCYVRAKYSRARCMTQWNKRAPARHHIVYWTASCIVRQANVPVEWGVANWASLTHQHIIMHTHSHTRAPEHDIKASENEWATGNWEVRNAGSQLQTFIPSYHFTATTPHIHSCYREQSERISLGFGNMHCIAACAAETLCVGTHTRPLRQWAEQCGRCVFVFVSLCVYIYVWRCMHHDASSAHGAQPQANVNKNNYAHRLRTELLVIPNIQTQHTHTWSIVMHANACHRVVTHDRHCRCQYKSRMCVLVCWYVGCSSRKRTNDAPTHTGEGISARSLILTHICRQAQRAQHTHTHAYAVRPMCRRTSTRRSRAAHTKTTTTTTGGGHRPNNTHAHT